MRARRTRPRTGCAPAAATPQPSTTRGQERRAPLLRYRLEATYELLPACEQTDLEDTLDRVSADLPQHEVTLISSHGRVQVVVEVEDDDVLEVYGRVAAALEQVVAALRGHWPARPDDGAEPTVLLADTSQSFL